MSDKKKAVFGIFKTHVEAEEAVDALKRDGFLASDISLLMPEGTDSQKLAYAKGTKAPEGAATGAGAGAILGGALGLLAGVGLLAVPGIGPLVAAGPIMASLAGAGAGGAIGGVGGALIGLGMPEYEAKRYETFVKNGAILLSVHTGTSDMIDKAKDCLERSHASDIASSGEVSEDWHLYARKSKDFGTENVGRNMN